MTIKRCRYSYDFFKKIYKILSKIYCYFRTLLNLAKYRKLKRNLYSHDVTVMSYLDTIEIAKKKSIIRFGDGEFNLIFGKDIGYQSHSKELEIALKEILSTDVENLLICVPGVFRDISHFNLSAKLFWSSYRVSNYLKLMEIINSKQIYGEAECTRPYIDLSMKLKRNASIYFDALKSLWNGKDVIIVEGYSSRNGIGNDLFDGVNRVRRIICPAANAFSVYNDIYENCLKFPLDTLFLISLGPTGKVLAYGLWKKGYHVLDIGHIDSDYEWYIHGATEKIRLNTNKHQAELDSGIDIELCDDEKYVGQIVCTIFGITH